jgi:hypothetical protein
MGKMIKIKYGWDSMKQGDKREFEETFKTAEEAVKWVNQLLKDENGEDAEQYETLTDIEINVYDIFGDTGAEIEY